MKKKIVLVRMYENTQKKVKLQAEKQRRTFQEQLDIIVLNELKAEEKEDET